MSSGAKLQSYRLNQGNNDALYLTPMAEKHTKLIYVYKSAKDVFIDQQKCGGWTAACPFFGELQQQQRLDQVG